MGFVNRWSGGCFGWIDDGALYTKDGRHVGRLDGYRIFAKDGRYIGELKSHRLIANIQRKTAVRGSGFVPAQPKALHPKVRPLDDVALKLPPGHEDFPSPDLL
ncbi:MAG TPA: hypothetical protein VMI56_05365 [Reyranella sp.]|nr:hypothetical protein [Reyranella sp.]